MLVQMINPVACESLNLAKAADSSKADLSYALFTVRLRVWVSCFVML